MVIPSQAAETLASQDPMASHWSITLSIHRPIKRSISESCQTWPFKPHPIKLIQNNDKVRLIKPNRLEHHPPLKSQVVALSYQAENWLDAEKCFPDLNDLAKKIPRY